MSRNDLVPDLRRGLKKEKLSAHEMNGKPAPLLSPLVQRLGVSENCAAHRQPLLLYQSFFFSSSPCALQVPPAASRLSPLPSASGG